MSCPQHVFYDSQCPACRQKKHEEFLERQHEERIAQIERMEEERREHEEGEAEREREREAEREERGYLDRIEREEAQERREHRRQKRHEETLQAAARQQEEITAQAHRLQSRDVAQRAQELYDVGSWDGAYAEACKAIELDHGNINAHQIAARALEKQGHHEAALKLRREGIRLLGMTGYRDNSNLFLQFLQSLPRGNTSLLQQFSEQVFRSSTSWSSQDRLEVVRQIVDLGASNSDASLIELIFSNASSGEKPELLVTVLRHPPKTIAHQLDSLIESVVADASSWTPQECSTVLDWLLHSGRLSSAKHLSELMLSRTLSPSLYLSLLRNAPKKAPWFDEVAERAFQTANTWPPDLRDEVLYELLGAGRTQDAKRFAELIYAQLSFKDEVRIFVALARRLPNEDAPWLDQFAEKLLANAEGCKPDACVDLTEQLINSGRLHVAKRLTELVRLRTNTLELEALLLEINERLGIASSESLKAYLGTIPCDRRSEVIASFRKITDSPGRFSAATISLIKEELGRRYEEWKPDIEKNTYGLVLQQHEKWSQPKVSGRGWLWGIGAYFILPYLAEPILRTLSSSPDPRFSAQALAVFGIGRILGSVLVGFLGWHLTRYVRTVKSIQPTIDSEVLRENDAWRSVYLNGISASHVDKSSVGGRALILTGLLALYMTIWCSILNTLQIKPNVR